jgi:hypothetical protein
VWLARAQSNLTPMGERQSPCDHLHTVRSQSFRSVEYKYTYKRQPGKHRGWC